MIIYHQVKIGQVEREASKCDEKHCAVSPFPLSENLPCDEGGENDSSEGYPIE
jgi:hypothetical protein